MKANKLFRKLALSGVALGAAAVTLTATTFAWYTSNTSVEVNQISGMTEATAGSSDIYVAAAQTYDTGAGIGRDPKTWGQFSAKVNPVLTGTKDSNSNFENVLKPVAYNGSTDGYQKLTGASAAASQTTLNTPTYASAAANDVYEYVLCFRTGTASSVATPLYFKSFALTATSASTAVDMVALVSGTGTGISEAGTYYADLIHSLKLSVETVNYTINSDNELVPATGTSAGNTYVVYDLENLADTSRDDNLNVTESTDDTPSVENAIGYLNKALGYNLAKPTSYAGKGTKVSKTAGATNAVSFASVPTTGYVMVRMVLWLDGWDEYCYDVMRQQTFTFSFSATTKDTESAIATA